jgi:hypothetical protein
VLIEKDVESVSVFPDVSDIVVPAHGNSNGTLSKSWRLIDLTTKIAVGIFHGNQGNALLEKHYCIKSSIFLADGGFWLCFVRAHDVTNCFVLFWLELYSCPGSSSIQRYSYLYVCASVCIVCRVLQVRASLA